jgi:hypothetical protein
VSSFGLDLTSASLGLALSVLAAALVLHLWRRAPVPSYRLGVAVLAAALALPLVQWAARALELPMPRPVGDLVVRLRSAAVPPAGEFVPLEHLIFAQDGPEESELPRLLPASLDSSALTATARTVPLERPSEGPLADPSLPSALRTSLFALYVAGLTLALGRMLRRLACTRRLLAGARPVTDAGVLALWEDVSSPSRLGRRTRLLESEGVETPACFGLGRPAVVLPVPHGLTHRPDVLRCVLTHELVHLERRDGWVLLGEELLRALFWFHPAAWWLVARLERLRELSCDSLVVLRTGKRKRYASALVEYATWMQAGARRPGALVETMAAVVPWSHSPGQLTRRIEMLLQPQTSKQGRTRVLAPAAVGMLFTFLWSGQIALATSSCASTSEAEAPVAEPVCEVEVYEPQVEAVATIHQGGQHKAVVVTKDGSFKHGSLSGHVTTNADGSCVLRLQDSDDPDGETRVIVLRDGQVEGDKWVSSPDASGSYTFNNGAKFLWHNKDKQNHGDLFKHKWKIVDGKGVDLLKGGEHGLIEVHGDEDGEALIQVDGQLHKLKVRGGKLKAHHGKTHVRHGQELGTLGVEVFGSGKGAGHGAGSQDSAFRGSGDQQTVDNLRRELEATRAALEAQRAEIEELRRAVEKLREAPKAKHSTPVLFGAF